MAVEAFGIIAGVVGIVSFALDLIPDGFDSATAVRIQVGLDSSQTGLSNSGGDVPLVDIFNENMESLSVGGFIGGPKIGSGDFVDISVQQGNGQQATFATFHAGNDAVCMAYLSATLADGTQFAWIGDNGVFCGLDWYESSIFLSSLENPLKCTWINADHTDGTKAGAIQIHWPSFKAPGEGDMPSASSLCASGAFRAFRNSDGTDELPTTKKRSEHRKPDDRLVISGHRGHNVTELCASETSRGPDFVSMAEGLYCDMTSREVLPLCDKATRGSCFDVESHTKITHRVGTRLQRRETKNYSKVLRW